MRWLLFLGAVLFGLTGALAADHVDGPETSGNSHGDLADLYAFPTNNGTSLAIVLNVHPFRSRLDSLSLETVGIATAGLDHDITLKIVMRKLTMEGEPAALVPMAGHYALTCTFRKAETLTCTDTDGRAFQTPFDQTQDVDGAKIFFGKAADPFFFDAEWALCVTRFAETSALERTKGGNTLHLQNLFSLVLEIPADRVLGGGRGLVGIVGETLVDGKPFDRVGRPEVTNVFMATQYVPQKSEELRDRFNRLPSFANLDNVYSKRIAEIVRFHDALVPPIDWTEGQVEHFAKIMASDFLTVDTGRLGRCLRDPFLDVELEMVLGNPGSHRTCGGRRFRDDVMDKIYHLLFSKGKPGAPIDKVEMPQLDWREGFPYVPRPHLLSLGTAAQIVIGSADPSERPDLCD